VEMKLQAEIDSNNGTISTREKANERGMVDSHPDL